MHKLSQLLWNPSSSNLCWANIAPCSKNALSLSMCILWSLWAGPTNEWPDVAPPVGKKKNNFLRKNDKFFSIWGKRSKNLEPSHFCQFLAISVSALLLFFFLSFFPYRQTFNKGFAVTERRPPLRPNSFHWKKKFQKLLQKCFFSLPAKENWRWEKLVIFDMQSSELFLRDLGSGAVAERLWAPAKLNLSGNSRRM